MAREDDSVGLFGRATGFLRDSWEELKKVHAPSRAETITATMGVLAMIIIFSVSLGLIDLVIGAIVRTVLYG